MTQQLLSWLLPKYRHNSCYRGKRCVALSLPQTLCAAKSELQIFNFKYQLPATPEDTCSRQLLLMIRINNTSTGPPAQHAGTSDPYHIIAPSTVHALWNPPTPQAQQLNNQELFNMLWALSTAWRVCGSHGAWARLQLSPAMAALMHAACARAPELDAVQLAQLAWFLGWLADTQVGLVIHTRFRREMGFLTCSF